MSARSPNSLYLFHFVVPPIVFHGQFQSFDLMAAAYYAANFMVSLALAIMLAAGVYRLVEVPGRRAIRAAADRWLGVNQSAQQKPPARPGVVFAPRGEG
jgi:peptidoglycan/LPS O-acetylase OafA/YrhL